MTRISPLVQYGAGRGAERPGELVRLSAPPAPQPECYYFKFDRPEGFGASFVGDQVFKSVDNSFSAIPGGCLHPQAVAPGFQMYTCWMIRHLDGDPWLQTTRNEDERYLWLHDAQE